ncbi:TonB-dependent receptor domain-containing protein [Novosphingobium terrae]|uniref:TonB-dependent receptor domain-containing protein n=1 Tax=Novosphingobium terrae TaxID=2726189 RepID=UPI001F141784|nr:TonB-dependent receptor [Novosphingobium terrae]
MREPKQGARCVQMSLLLGVAFCSLMPAGMAMAQTAKTPSDAPAPADDDKAEANTIVVTGSRIATAVITAQPITRVTGEDIGKRGFTNLGMALLDQPAFGVPGNGPVGGQGSFSAGQTFANLYDLGSQRTLTLVNGNRFVSPASGSIFGPVAGSPVDLSQIAPGLVDRIEVVSVGGAPIYGSDAIAGTVNVILKKNYQGLAINASQGISGHGDAQDSNVSLLAGKNFADGRGNITVSVYYDRQVGLTNADRSSLIGGTSPFSGTATAGKSYTHQLYYGGKNYNTFTNTGIPAFADDVPIYAGQAYAGITNAAGQVLYFNNSGQLTPFTNGQLTGSGLYQAGGSGFAIANYDNFLADTQRIQGTLLGHYDFTDHIHFSGEFWLGRNFGTNLAAQPYYNTALFAAAGETNGNLALSTANPYLSAADRQTIISNLAANGMPTDTFYLARANTDLATGSFRTRTDLVRVVGGLNGDFGVGERKFDWDVTVNYGRSTSTTTSRELVTQNFYNALNAVTNSSGQIACAPGYANASYPTLSSTCAPLDIFGYGNASQQAINYVTAIAQTHQVNTQLDVQADVKGDLIKLPGGYAKGVVGYEYRRESSAFDPGAFYAGELQADGSRVQYGNTIPITPVGGKFHTNEVFGELNAPIISPDNDIPFISSLDINAAVRYVNHSLTGGFTSYTAGGTYAPVKGLTIRGNFTRSFRSPAITELFAPTGSVFDTANDPCDARYINAGNNPAARKANCAAAGITQPFTSNVVDYTAKGTSGGNPNLQNETANSWTLGAVLQPHVLRGLELSVDYINIDIGNEIATLSLTDLMSACYDSSSSSPFCKTFTRDSTGQVTSFEEGNYNIGQEAFRALQGNLKYNLPLERLGLPTSAGVLDLNVNYLHTFRHYYRVGSGDLQQVVGASRNPANTFTATANYTRKSFNWMVQGIYYGSSKVDPNVDPSAYQYPTVHSYVTFNTSLGVDVSKNVNFRFIVNNVFNRGLPFPYSIFSESSYEARYYDAIMGRYFRVNASVKF